MPEAARFSVLASVTNIGGWGKKNEESSSTSLIGSLKIGVCIYIYVYTHSSANTNLLSKEKDQRGVSL